MIVGIFIIGSKISILDDTLKNKFYSEQSDFTTGYSKYDYTSVQGWIIGNEIYKDILFSDEKESWVLVNIDKPMPNSYQEALELIKKYIPEVLL